MEDSRKDPCPVGIRGIVPSLNTPFTADDAVDLDSVRRLVDWTVASGAAGMLVLAVAGEGQSLHRGEFRAVAEAIAAQNAGRIPIILSVPPPDPPHPPYPSRAPASSRAAPTPL